MKFNQQTTEYIQNRTPGYLSKDQNPDDLTKYLRLDLGENLLGCSPKVITWIRHIYPEYLRYYADPCNSAIKKTISLLYEIQKDNITLSNSSNEIIDYLPKITLEPKDRVVIVTPTFFRYTESSLAAGGLITYVSLQEKDNYEYTDAVVDAIVDRTNRLQAKLIWLCNPNNPTGSVLDIDSIERIVKNTTALVILDEAFYEYYDSSNTYSGVQLIEKYENIIVLRTLSKAYGLAGLRLGYALAHKNIIRQIELYRDTLLMTSALVQKIALSALQDQRWLARTTSKTKMLRETLERDLQKIPNIDLIHPSKTNIYLLRHKYRDLYQYLKTRNILSADFRQSKGLEGKRFVRVTIGNQRTNETLLSTLRMI